MAAKDEMFSSSYFDLYDGARHATERLRQLRSLVQGPDNPDLWPLAIVNVATCLEWFARSMFQQLIDFAAEQINPDAKILRDLKISYAVVLQARSHNLSIGAIVASSRNFSSFDEIDTALTDLMNNPKPNFLARVKAPLSQLIDFAFCRSRRKMLSRELNEMFRRRHELVHGSPRHLSFENELDVQLNKKELLKFINCALMYVTQMNRALYRFIPELAERSTVDINSNQRQRLANSDDEIDRLVSAIERRIGQDAPLISEFRQTQRAWRLWRDRESRFQSSDWRGGSGRTAIILGLRTSFNVERLRNLESYLRELDNRAAMRV